MSPSKDTVLLLLNGELSDALLVKRLARRARFVLCADGGARHAARLKIEPRFVVGDMDSLPHPLPRWKNTTYWCDFDQNRSDFEKALHFAQGIGCRRLWVAGGMGGRLDHAMVNLGVVERYSGEFDITLIDEGMARLLHPGRHSFMLPRGKTISLLAAAPRAKVSLSGTRYPLHKAALTQGSRGLSNKAIGPVHLTLHSGRVWVITQA